MYIERGREVFISTEIIMVQRFKTTHSPQTCFDKAWDVESKFELYDRTTMDTPIGRHVY